MILFFFVNKKSDLGQYVITVLSKYSSSKTISQQLTHQYKYLLFVISNAIFIYCTKIKLIYPIIKIIRKK